MQVSSLLIAILRIAVFPFHQSAQKSPRVINQQPDPLSLAWPLRPKSCDIKPQPLCDLRKLIGHSIQSNNLAALSQVLDIFQVIFDIYTNSLDLLRHRLTPQSWLCEVSLIFLNGWLSSLHLVVQTFLACGCGSSKANALGT